MMPRGYELLTIFENFVIEYDLGYIELVKLQIILGVRTTQFEKILFNRMYRHFSRVSEITLNDKLFRKNSRDMIRQLINALRGLNVVISGSFVLEILYSDFHAGDIDIYVNNDDFRELIERFDFYEKFCVYSNTQYSKKITSKHIKIYNINKNELVIQIIRVNCDPRDFIKINFDADIVNNYVQMKAPGGYKLYIKNLRDVIHKRSIISLSNLNVLIDYTMRIKQIGGSIMVVYGDSIISGKIRPSLIKTMISMAQNARSERIEKYADRGITLTPRDFTLPEMLSSCNEIIKLLRVNDYGDIVHNNICCAVRNALISECTRDHSCNSTPGSFCVIQTDYIGRHNCCYCYHKICNGISHCQYPRGV